MSKHDARFWGCQDHLEDLCTKPGFIHTVRVVGGIQPWPTAFVQLGSIPLDPSEDGGMVNRQSVFLHELFHISVTQGIA